MQVATLTKHLRDTNEDLRQAQEAIERFEGESTAGSGGGTMVNSCGLLPTLPPTALEKAAGTPTSGLPTLALEAGAVWTLLQMMGVTNAIVQVMLPLPSEPQQHFFPQNLRQILFDNLFGVISSGTQCSACIALITTSEAQSSLTVNSRQSSLTVQVSAELFKPWTLNPKLTVHFSAGTQGGWEQGPSGEQHWNSDASPNQLQKPQPRKPSVRPSQGPGNNRLAPNATTSVWPPVPQGQEEPDDSMEPASAARHAASEVAEQPRRLSSKLPQTGRPNRASITAQIERAGRLQRRLSGQLEAAGVAHQPHSRRGSAKAAHSSEFTSLSKRQEVVGA